MILANLLLTTADNPNLFTRVLSGSGSFVVPGPINYIWITGRGGKSSTGGTGVATTLTIEGVQGIITTFPGGANGTTPPLTNAIYDMTQLNTDATFNYVVGDGGSLVIAYELV